MYQSPPLGCERVWSRVQVRSEMGLGLDTPWLVTSLWLDNERDSDLTPPLQTSQLTEVGAVDIESPAGDPDTAARSVSSELRWIVPGLQVGVVLLAPQPSHATGLGDLSWSDHVRVSRDGGNLLDWMLAADAWLLSDDSCLSEELAHLAYQLRLPCFGIGAPTNLLASAHPSRRWTRWSADPLTLARSIASCALSGHASYPVASVHVDRGENGCDSGRTDLEAARLILQRLVQRPMKSGPWNIPIREGVRAA